MWNLPGSQDAFRMLHSRDHGPPVECQMSAQAAVAGGVWSWTQSTAIFCVSFISLLTLSSAFTSPNRVFGYNLFYLSERRNLAPRSFLLTGFEEGTSCYKLSLTFTVYRRDSL